MTLQRGKAQILKIYLGETDHYHGKPLYEALVIEARETGMAGATAYKGMLSFGASHSIHTLKIFALSSDLPVIVEIVDSSEKISAFAEKANEMLEKSGKGGLVTIQDLEVINYKTGEKYKEVK
ncbi:MAG: hypothetical protein A2W90_22070 [Bacteroidetes bacterium GWF2_42_66]|nr:MAG: hypothetical protein A2W92_13985 [Bacteroidetes bacterium GWA2_42_15]OFY02156.1 MAG: hypothetical protein A2W89_11190 [Bacteroidetes bacterium GWE2_42_39]OFY43602.1 MAG: hypothetical protein A2W90_22070 [Bacteroidetes bacterium GWF2_42_66]HBL75232.1 hypothetical protein [Prolixibacteraceae bacterium]HCU59692.1 hypothetical protein [Prolixibacteraceae bacterium]